MAIMVIDDVVFPRQFDSMQDNFGRIVGQIFKLLPTREEGLDWEKPLDTLIVEIIGYSWILPDSDKLEMLVSKLRGLKSDECKSDFMLYRRMVFEACSVANDLKESLGEVNCVNEHDAEAS
jgi:hypothetical protein